MVKFLGEQHGRKLVGFGLSDGNIEKLRQGLPIVLDMKAMHPELDARVVIFWGETEASMSEKLTSYGLVGPHPVIRSDPRLHPNDTPAEETR